jgi:hypothetical protein
MWPWIGEAR